MKIATWNVNSVNARLQTVLAWFKEAQPDVACLQELKCVDEKFPREPFEAMGYNLAVFGQKSWNGVALLSKHPLSDVRRGLPGEDSDEHSRYVEAVVEAPTPVRVASIYLPNGNPVATDKFPYKLRWMERLRRHAAELLEFEERLVLAGDYNVIPTEADVYDWTRWTEDALFRPESRAAFRALRWLGLADAHEQASGRAHEYTFWDYQAGAWDRNHGIRIDHALLSPQAADVLTGFEVHRAVRGRSADGERPSDHVPVMIELAG
jgi:exodeoxyribonuclease-3